MLTVLLHIYLLSYAYPAGCYENDANKDLHSGQDPLFLDRLQVASRPTTTSPLERQVSGFQLESPEYAIWMSYTVFSVMVFSYLGWVFRYFIARLVQHGLHGITGVRLVIEINRGRDTTRIRLGGAYSIHTERQGEEESDIELQEVATHSVTTTSQGIAEPADTFYDCITSS